MKLRPVKNRVLQVRVKKPRHVSDIEWVMNSACLRKKNLSEEEANRIIDYHFKNGRLLYYYKCPFCLSFHLTKKSEEVQERLIAI